MNVRFCGEWGIRTLGPAVRDNGFRDRPDRPLRQLSVFKVKNIKKNNSLALAA